MALVIQNEAMTGSYVPYERPPQPFTLWSAIPRGLQSFISAGVQLDAISAGNDALLSLEATLPPNFGYVMMDANVTLAMVAAGIDWASRYNLNLQNYYRSPEDTSLALSNDWPQQMLGTAQDDSVRAMQQAFPWPSFPIIGTAGTSGIQIVQSTFNNAGTARSAGVINAYISFWVFDLEQIRKYPINSPQPVHAR